MTNYGHDGIILDINIYFLFIILNNKGLIGMTYLDLSLLRVLIFTILLQLMLTYFIIDKYGILIRSTLNVS